MNVGRPSLVNGVSLPKAKVQFGSGFLEAPRESTVKKYVAITLRNI